MGTKARILHAVVNMNRGGAETLIMNLYRRIDRTRIQFDFLTCREGEFDDEIRALGGMVHRIPWVKDAGHFGYQRALDEFFTEHHRYPVVHAHMDRMSGWVLKAARRAGIPVRIAHSHNTRSEGGTAVRLYKWAAGRHILPNATDLAACSEAAAAWLFGRQAAAARLIRNAVDCSAFAFAPQVRQEMRAQLRLNPGQLAVFHAGRFNRQKNHTYLIDLFAQLTFVRPDAVLFLAGAGPLRDEIERQADDAGLSERVRFLGVRSDIPQLMQAMDVMVFPSLHEGLPVTLIEAQSASLPCVVSDRVTAEADLGLGLMTRLPLEAPQSHWLAAIEQAAAGCTAEEREHLDAAAKVRERGYDIDAAAADLADYYGQVILRRTAHPPKARRSV